MDKETSYQEFMPTPVGPELQKLIPEIEHQTRFVSGTGVVRYEGNIFQETIDLVDSPFFSMFSFPLIYGNPETVLSADHQIVLSRSCAKKYFGQEDPIGKTLTIAFGRVNKDFTVTGMAEDVPLYSSLQFNILILFDNLPILFNNPDILNDWRRWFCPSFIQIRPNVQEEQLKGILDQFCRQYYSVENKRYMDGGHEPNFRKFSHAPRFPDQASSLSVTV
jgi:putative ABC transport system permease protein